MSFELFGFDFSLKLKNFGFWIFGIEFYRSYGRKSLVTLYWADKELIIDIFWFRVVHGFFWGSDEN